MIYWLLHDIQSQDEMFSGLIYGHQLAGTIGKYVIDLELVCEVLDMDNMINRIEYLSLD